MPSVLFWTPETVPACFRAADKDDRVFDDRGGNYITRASVDAINALIKRDHHRRVKWQRVAVHAVRPEDGSAATGSAAFAAALAAAVPPFTFTVAQSSNAGSWELCKAALWDIIVVVEDAKMTCDFDLYEPNAANTLKNLNEFARKIPTFQSRPGATIIFVGSKPTSRTTFAAYVKSAEMCRGRRLHFIDGHDKQGGYGETRRFWAKLLTAVVEAQVGYEPSAAALQARCSSGAEDDKDFASPAQLQALPPMLLGGKQALPLLPRAWSATPSIQFIMRPHNRSRRLCFIVLEGVVTLHSTVFKATGFPCTGATFTLGPAQACPQAIEDIEGYMDGAACDIHGAAARSGPFVAGDIFYADLRACNRGGAHREGSMNSLRRNAEEGDVLRALPWGDQPHRDKIWAEVHRAVVVPRQQWCDRVGAKQQQQTAAAAAAAAPTAPQATTATPPLPTALDHIYRTPTSAHALLYVSLRPLFNSEKAAKDFQNFVAAIKPEVHVHILTGTCDSHHLYGVLRRAKPQVDDASGAPAPVTHVDVVNYSDHSTNGASFFTNGMLSRATNDESEPLLHAATGAPIYMIGNIAPTGGGSKMSVAFEVCQLAPLEAVAPAAFFDAQLRKEQQDLVLPYSIYAKTAAMPRGAEAAAERDRRADAIIQNNPLFAEPWLAENYDEDVSLELLLARNAFSRFSGHEISTWGSGIVSPAAAGTAGTATATTTPQQRLDAALQQYVQRQRDICDPASPRYIDSNVRPAERDTAPSLLEWVLGVWLPPHPAHIKQLGAVAARRANMAPYGRASWMKLVNTAVFADLSSCLADGQAHLAQAQPGGAWRKHGVTRLLQIVFALVVENNYKQQVVAGHAIPLAHRSFFCFLMPQQVSQRIVRDISSADKKLVQQLLGVATLAARAGNIALAAGICTRLLGACCVDDIETLFGAQPACTALPLFPPGLPGAILDKLYAPPQPKFYPALDPTVRQDRQTKSDAMNKARVFDTSLDSVLVALVASPAARKSPLFAAAVAHIAFAQIRIVMTTRRDRSGAQFLVASSGTTHALQKAIVAAKPRVEAHRSAMTPMDSQNLKFLCTAEAAIHTFCWQHRREALLSPRFPGDVVHMVPASCAFLFWFIHDALSTQVRRRIDAGTSSLCDASFLSARVMEFLLDMP